MSVGRRTITVYLMRHAESESNIDLNGEEIEDIKNTELSELGREQIKQIAKVWKDVEFRKVYSSDFKRALDTAKGILKYQGGMLTKPEVEIDVNLREMDFGKLNTKSYEEITLHYLSLNEPYLEWKYPEGESVFQVGKRMLNFVEKNCTNLLNFGDDEDNDKIENINVLIVTHRVSIATLLYLLSNPVDGVDGRFLVENFDEYKDIKLVNNTGYYKLEVCKMNNVLSVKVIEKFVVSHLSGIDCARFGKVEERKGNENRLKERLLKEASERGRKVLDCCQQ